ncbi:Transmembrane 9 superfamily member 1, partial [Mucuna pruriens]
MASKHILYTHKYNDDRIIHVNLNQDIPKPLEVGTHLDMTYSVKWISTNVTFGFCFDVYLDYPFFEHQERDVNGESGWNLVHGD